MIPQTVNPKGPTSTHPRWLEDRFQIGLRGSTVQRELLAGVTTFMTMAYIMFVNPAILAGTGMPTAAVAAATCLGAAVPTLLMGWWANYPFALASGMGLNAAVALHAAQNGATWQTMMGVIVIEGLIVTLLVVTQVREQVMNAIPVPLKRAISLGIGLFIAFLGLQQMGWVSRGTGGAFLAPGPLAAKTTLVASAGFLLLASLLALRIRGAILLGIIGTAVLAWLADRLAPSAQALVHLPDRWIARPDFSTLASADIRGALRFDLISVIFAFLITDFFDTMGTVIGVGGQAGFLDRQGRLPRLNRVLLVDSLAAVWGGFCGASSVTTYIESAAGTSEGGRTGLVSVVVGFLFLAGLFVAPIVAAVPAVATAPALVVVGFLMMAVIKDIDLTVVEEGIPTFLTIVAIPLTQSISFGIGMGFISYVLLMLIRGRGREVSAWLYLITALFLVSFAFANG